MGGLRPLVGGELGTSVVIIMSLLSSRHLVVRLGLGVGLGLGLAPDPDPDPDPDPLTPALSLCR